MRIVANQSNYIPWRGYFKLVANADVFIVLDSLQYTKNDWRNRNKLRGPNGTFWLTIPVSSVGGHQQTINRTSVVDSKWYNTHLKSFNQALSTAPYFDEIARDVEVLYNSCKSRSLLSDINMLFIDFVTELLGFGKSIVQDFELDLFPSTYHRLDKSERVLAICKELDANSYLTGPSGLSYLNLSLFAAAGITIETVDYRSLLDYEQRYVGFSGDVSILDFIANVGISRAASEITSETGIYSVVR